MIDVAGLPPDRYVFAPSPLGELAAMLHALVEPGHHPELHGWVAATVAGLESGLRERIEESELLWRSARGDFLLPARPRATLAEELDDVDRLDDDAWVSAALVTTSCGAARARRTGSPLADSAGREQARALALARGPRQAEFADRLLADPPAVRAWVRALLEDCERAFFAGSWARVRPALAADARHKGDLLTRHGPAAALAAVSPSVSVSAEGDRILVDKLTNAVTTAAGQGVTFAPTVFGRPHLLVVHAPGWRPVIQYPTADPALPQPVPLALVRRRLDALAHPVRQELARTLARGSHTTGELAAARNLSAPEVSRHLRVLRTAGLVTATRCGRYVRYELDRAACARVGADLVAALLR